MAGTSAHPLELWLPALQRFDPAHPLQRLLARADRFEDGPQGYLEGLGGFFRCDVQPLPAAALTRELARGDAADALWLSADPAWVQPEMNGARLLASGRLGLSEEEAEALAAPLRPLFGDAGMQLELTTPDRWHLRLSPGSPLPPFAAPEQALGEHLLQHLPHGPGGRRWRLLLTEAQVLLHQHPLNAERRARGQPPVNSLWLWGGGRLPHRVGSTLAGVVGDDPLLCALAAHAGLPQQARDLAQLAQTPVGWLVDLQDLTAADIERDAWPAIEARRRRDALRFHFASGERYLHRPWHRWRAWRGGRA
ncbi:phosphoglycerate mutase [Frateuria defendens]|uniref:phosphoglycerate mutase n=1 Tax=Frateuria defendens TaxID=2219559 RepID=UPI00069D4F85|nr:phosphoglycerate mutase [Frateuria defendens]